VTRLVSSVSEVEMGFWTEQARRTRAHRTDVAAANNRKTEWVDGGINTNPADLRFLAGNRLSAGLDNGAPESVRPEHPYARCSKGCKVTSAGLLA
jgi:hypothetical protein